MSVLRNLKHERFANHVAGGLSQAEAFKSAGFKAKHVDSAASKLAGKPQVTDRIKELTARIAKATVRRVAERVAITTEIIIQELWENAQSGKNVRGGSAVTNRALELIGKELGMFRDPVDKPPVKLEDLPPEVLANMLAEAETAAALERNQAAGAQRGNAPAPTKVKLGPVGEAPTLRSAAEPE